MKIEIGLDSRRTEFPAEFRLLVEGDRRPAENRIGRSNVEFDDVVSVRRLLGETALPEAD